jgi:peroxiredoxin
MAEVPLLKALHEKYATQGLVIVGVSIDSAISLANRTIKEKGMTWTQLVDAKGFNSDVAQAYRVEGTPTVFVVDRAGKIVARPSSAKGIEDNLSAALK